jgi:glutaredoxin 3
MSTYWSLPGLPSRHERPYNSLLKKRPIMVAIDIYTVQYCPYCQDAKDLLSRKGVHFHEIDVTGKRDVRKEMVRRAHGRSTYPQIFIGAIHVGGCEDLYALEEAGKLDSLLAESKD